MFFPRKKTLPSVGLRVEDKSFNKVVLPAPDEPVIK